MRRWSLLLLLFLLPAGIACGSKASGGSGAGQTALRLG
jgi:hypothetical protein